MIAATSGSDSTKDFSMSWICCQYGGATAMFILPDLRPGEIEEGHSWAPS